MRNMSFALTTAQILAKQKTVTRRLGWTFLKPGDVLQPVLKCQGLKKGERIEKLGGPIRVVSIERAPLNAITPQDVYREGFPQMTREAFIAMFKASHRGCRVGSIVTRIEFSYVECGNSIKPQVAQVFIEAYLDTERHLA